MIRTVLKAWRRPTLPRLKPEYHRRWRVSLPSSGWDRVLGPPLWPPGRQEGPDACVFVSDVGWAPDGFRRFLPLDATGLISSRDQSRLSD